ncbi:hypothetical protein LCGC14_1190990 [marine sediment metagenome]|uniref:Uncharacterized protein n=1 Tax=marine sediment metagenome TaxID=412755 RepID=A0A0F9LP43_9ZZZZ
MTKAKTIGKKNVELVRRITKEEIAKKLAAEDIVENYLGIEEIVIERLPEAMWGTCENAPRQIKRIITRIIEDEYKLVT